MFLAWQARVSPRLVMQTAFAFGPYLLLWLLLPGALAWAVWRKKLWRELLIDESRQGRDGRPVRGGHTRD